ncbi:hypothetical protein ACVDG9_18335 [Roseibium sp. RP-7]
MLDGPGEDGFVKTLAVGIEDSADDARRAAESAVHLRQHGVTSDVTGITDIAIEMADLYRESVAAILEDDTMVFHVLPMTDVAGTFISSMGVDPDLDKSAEAICGTTLNYMDCVVVLGSDILREHRTGEEMAEIAIGHIEQHINTVWPPEAAKAARLAPSDLGRRLEVTAYLTPSKIALADIDANLREEMDAVGFTAYRADEMNADGFLTGNAIHIIYHDEAGRAGLVYVGSGSSGLTGWTDASSPEDALRRYLVDDMVE